MTHQVVHWEIGGPDAAALREFYGKAFGWSMTAAGPDYSIVDTGAGGLAGGIMQTHDDMPAYVTVYIQVDDLGAALAQIETLGGRATVPPTPISDTMSFALFTDPGGAMVGLLQTDVPAADT